MKAQFTLRDLLWLFVVVALGFGWWVDRSAAVAQAVGQRDIWIDNTCRLSKFIQDSGHGTVLCSDSGGITIGNTPLPRK